MEANYFTTFQWVLSHIDMNQPWSYMYSPSRSPLPPPSPPDSSGSSQCTRPEQLSHASHLGWWSEKLTFSFVCFWSVWNRICFHIFPGISIFFNSTLLCSFSNLLYQALCTVWYIGSFSFALFSCILFPFFFLNFGL